MSVYTKVETFHTDSRVKLHSAKQYLEERKCNEIINDKSLSEGVLHKINTEIEAVMGKEYKQICTSFDMFFDHDDDKETLQRWKFSTKKEIQRLKSRLQDETKDTCKQCLDNKKTVMHVDSCKQEYQRRIITHAQTLAKKLKGSDVNENQLQQIFEKEIWQGLYTEVTALTTKEKPVDIAADAAVVMHDK